MESNKKILGKLEIIQSELKSPKGQKNKFGGYNYRSMDDINQAIKPLLKKTKTILTASDELVCLNDSTYIKAKVTLICIDSGESISCYGFAKESKDKKGFDPSQETGAASSYARKYAANGLLAIDDTKDADATNDGSRQKTNKPTKDQGQAIKDLSNSLGLDPMEAINMVLKKNAISEISTGKELTNQNAILVIDGLTQKLKEKNKEAS